MSLPTFHWQISITEEYFHQVSILDLGIQNNIQNQWIEVSKHRDPREVGSWDSCGADIEVCPLILVIFVGIPFEFMYEIDTTNQELVLVDCYPLEIFHPNSE